jgi:hypothetical protein
MEKRQLCWATASGFDLDGLLPDLEKEINIKIGAGWTPMGGPIETIYHGVRQLRQVMYRVMVTA